MWYFSKMNFQTWVHNSSRQSLVRAVTTPAAARSQPPGTAAEARPFPTHGHTAHTQGKLAILVMSGVREN